MSRTIKDISNWEQVRMIDAKFLRIFKVRFIKFLDTMLLISGCGIHLDIIRFDSYLERTYRDYREGMSMDEFLTMKFGLEATKFIEELI